MDPVVQAANLRLNQLIADHADPELIRLAAAEYWHADAARVLAGSDLHDLVQWACAGWLAGEDAATRAAAAEQVVAGDRDAAIRLLAVASDLADRAWWMTGAVTARWLRAALNQC